MAGGGQTEEIMHKALVLAAVFSFANLTAAHAADGTFRVTLLGSGTPTPSLDRFGQPL
jgi:hypothetical protein